VWSSFARYPTLPHDEAVRRGWGTRTLTGWILRLRGFGEVEDEVDEGAELGGWELARGVEGVEGEALVGPVGEELDELAAIEQGLDAESHDLGDADAGEAGIEEGAGVGDEEASCGLDGDDLAGAVELPLEGLGGDGIAKLQAGVGGEVGGPGGAAVAFEIGGGGDGEDAGVEELADDEGGGRLLAKADGDVEAFGDEVAEVGAGDEFEGELGVAVEETADGGGEQEAGEEGIDVDAEAAADSGGGAGGGGDGVVDAVEHGGDLIVEGLALGGELDGAGGAMEEADADAGFEAGDGVADGGLREAEGVGGADEAAAFDDCGEDADAGEEATVEG